MVLPPKCLSLDISLLLTIFINLNMSFKYPFMYSPSPYPFHFLTSYLSKTPGHLAIEFPIVWVLLIALSTVQFVFLCPFVFCRLAAASRGWIIQVGSLWQTIGGVGFFLMKCIMSGFPWFLCPLVLWGCRMVMSLFCFHFVAEVILLTDASFSSPLCLQFMWERGKNADADSFFDSRNGKVLQPNIYVDCVLARPPVLLFVSF